MAKKLHVNGLFDNDAVVKSVNGVTPDDSGNVSVEVPEGFSGSWNDLTEKPFEEVHASSNVSFYIRSFMNGFCDDDANIDIESITSGNEYEFTFAPVDTVTYQNVTYLPKTQTVSAIASKTFDRDGYPAVSFEFEDLHMNESSDGSNKAFKVKSLMFYSSGAVRIYTSKTTVIRISTPIPVNTTLPGKPSTSITSIPMVCGDQDIVVDVRITSTGAIAVENKATGEVRNTIMEPTDTGAGCAIAVLEVDENGKPTEWGTIYVPTYEDICSLIDTKLAAIPNAEEASF